jgi:hypothetical protein
MAKIKGVKPNLKAANFMGRGVASNDPGTTPNHHQGMGMYYGTGLKNPQGKMRGDSLGYRPVSHKQLGTPPKSVV